MHQNIRVRSLLGIFSLVFVMLTGCGEKRVHVSTASGAPGEDMALNGMTDDLADQATSGLNTAGIDESALSSQVPDGETTSTDTTASSFGNEPLNMAHAPARLSPQDHSSDSSNSSLADELADAGGSENANSSPSMSEGQDFSTQSSSFPGDQANRSSENSGEFQNSANSEPLDTGISQDSLAGLEDILSGENLESMPDTLQIAKIEPSSGLEDRMNQINEEELEAAKAGLEDVFFQFDSWTLTQEGKESLHRTLGWFEQESDSTLIIEGHADQRGTQAYNMVLAKKRAVAVQDYLSQLGVDGSRMSVISYGKDKPFCQDSTEVCHQLNRRGHLLVAN